MTSEELIEPLTSAELIELMEQLSANPQLRHWVPEFLHWLPEQDRWETISFRAWEGFLHGGARLPGIGAGIHFFMVCIRDQHDRPVNFVPHKLLIEPSGKICRKDNFGGLTREEREYTKSTMFEKYLTDSQWARLNAIREKDFAAACPPAEALAALRRSLAPPPPERGSYADHFLDGNWTADDEAQEAEEY